VRLFCDIALAKRIERVEAQLIAAAAAQAGRRSTNGFVMEIAGGVACFAEPGSPFNKVCGVGFDGVPADLKRVERAFADVGATVQFEVSNLADPALVEMLTGRGYRLVSFENVLGRLVAADEAPQPAGEAPQPADEAPKPHGVDIRRIGEDEFDTWISVTTDGNAQPDVEGVPSHEEFPRDVVERAERDMAAAGLRYYLALVDGVPAGGGSMRIAEGVAQLTGAATAPAYRRRGAQSALLQARLNDAATQGCDIATVTTQPASKSQQNAQRRDFDLLYTRAILVKVR
jgi:GNAT superfamily N-acetyltransferase